MAADGLLSGTGYERIDHLDYRDWLTRHGAARETIDSPIVRGMYDLTSLPGAATAPPPFSAGRHVRLQQLACSSIQGIDFLAHAGGYGEIIFAPLYEALTRRGVDSASSVAWTACGSQMVGAISSIDLSRQANLKQGQDRYEPLVRVHELPCWPDRPLVEQLDTDPGDGLESHGKAAMGSGVEARRRQGLDVACSQCRWA